MIYLDNDWMFQISNSDTRRSPRSGACSPTAVYVINQFMRDAIVPAVISEEQPDFPVGSEGPVDHGRLRYVTRLLGSHQGLYTALLGTVIFFMNTGKILQHWVSGWSILLAALATVALEIGGMKILIAADTWIPDYYQRRFGSVQAVRAPVSKWNALFSLALLLALLVLLFLGRPIAHYFDPVVSHQHMMMSDPDRLINLWPSLLWTVLLCGSLRWHMSSIERQRLYLILVATLGLASIVSYAIFHPEAKQLGLWKLLNTGGFGLSLIALGLYDYIVLVRALPKRVAEGEDE
jgi:hypothetical protein